MEPLKVFGTPLRHSQLIELPPFPTPEELKIPIIPPAGPFFGDPILFAKQLWRTGIFRLYGVMSTPPNEVQEASRVCVLQLEALEIPPAEWLLCRLNAFVVADVPEKLSHAPFGFVFSPKALARELEGPMRWRGQLATPRTLHTFATQRAVTAWHKLRTSRCVEEYLAVLKTTQEENQHAAAEVLSEYKAGVYVW